MANFTSLVNFLRSYNIIDLFCQLKPLNYVIFTLPKIQIHNQFFLRNGYKIIYVMAVIKSGQLKTQVSVLLCLRVKNNYYNNQ